ncbi:MAG: hypothetical protein AAF228_10035 [Pseudomonadota bacterium]
MSFYDWVSDTIVEPPAQRSPVNIGWLFSQKSSSVIYFEPERMRSANITGKHAKSASRCPAVLSMETRYFVIKCPFDIHLGFERDKSGKPTIINRQGNKSPVRKNKLNQLITIVNEEEWRYKDRPTIQISTPYLFISDEPVFMSQIAPFMHYQATPWPGTIFGGRFPIHAWPRVLMWAFEWHDTSQDLILKRGDPWFYVTFETLPADRAIIIEEAQLTEELEDYIEQISGAVNYVNQTFSLFKNAEKRRPEKLLRFKSED